MQRILILLLLAAAPLTPCLAQSPLQPVTGKMPAGEMAVRDVLERQSQAWNRGAVDSFMLGYWHSDSLMFIGKSGVTYGWDQTLANYRKNYPDRAAMGQLVFDLLVVEPLSPEYYHVVGKWTLHRSIGDVSGHFTLLFRKIRGSWVVIEDHSS